MKKSAFTFAGLSTGLQVVMAEVMIYLHRITFAVLLIAWLLTRLLSLLVVRAIRRLDGGGFFAFMGIATLRSGML